MILVCLGSVWMGIERVPRILCVSGVECHVMGLIVLLQRRVISWFNWFLGKGDIG